VEPSRVWGAVVALKILRDANGVDESRFRREVAILANLNDPAIVRYIESGTHDGALYLVTEWLEGETLGQRLARGPLTITESIAVAAKVASRCRRS
jgi:eukaryotic-like serine/threonine-protein kinase